MPTFAQPVPDDIVASSGLRSKFRPHVHGNYQICVEPSKGMETFYNDAMSTQLESKTLADIPGLGLVHPMALAMANCLPERLPAITRFADFTILNDDYYDIAKRDEIEKVNSDIQNALQDASAPGSKTQSSAGSDKDFKPKQMQAALVLELIMLDQQLAMDIMSSYSQGLDVATFAPDNLRTLDEYLPVRKVNSGLDVTAEMVCFGMGLRISPSDKAKLRPVVDLANFAITVVNDLYSWPKEIKCHLETPGSELPFNAVAVLMRHGGYSEPEAFRILYAKQAELEAEHLRQLDALRAQEGGRLPENQELYVENAQRAVCGSELWSVYTRRYPSKADLRQPEVEFVDGAFRYVADGEGAGEEKVVSESVDSLPTTEVEDEFSSSDASPGSVDQAISTPPSTTFCSCEDEEEHIADVKEAVIAPIKYLATLPSKGVRDTFIDALNWWLEVPEDSLRTIKTIISMLHDSSLILDDIEDDSTLRRGSPAAHMIFGTAQCINAANHIFVMVLAELQKLRSPLKTAILIEELESLFVGQADDLHWKYHVDCPSTEDYMEMIDNKTGGLFRLCVRLLQAESTRTDVLDLDPRPFVRQLSLFFQIRDDYQNLVSDAYAKQKGFAEDLDEGKISLPIILTLQRARTRPEIMGVLKHKQPGPMAMEMKQYIVKEMEKCGALESTRELLQGMQEDLIAELRRLEGDFGAKNATLELVLRRLWIS
ncbi:Ophiobolin F synthase [Colletotrichum siamense]|nr:Ophiobolin F synthase [Colletotrichum siamense]